MSNQKERYMPVLVAIDTSVRIGGNAIGGFLCKTPGTITLTNLAGQILVDAIPVTAGIYYPLPFLLVNNGGSGGVFTCAAGASGTLGV